MIMVLEDDGADDRGVTGGSSRVSDGVGDT